MTALEVHPFPLMLNVCLSKTLFGRVEKDHFFSAQDNTFGSKNMYTTSKIHMVAITWYCHEIIILTYVTGPGKTGLIYTKHMCLYHRTYLLFCVCYPQSVSFTEFLMDLCIYDDILDAIRITDKKLLHFKLSKSGQILHVDKTCFPRPGHICTTQQLYKKV